MDMNLGDEKIGRLISMERSFRSTLLALLRDVIIFVPASIALAGISHSIVTMLWAAVISDVIAAGIRFIFLRNTIKTLEKENLGWGRG